MESTLNERNDLDAEFNELPDETDDTPKVNNNYMSIIIAILIEGLKNLVQHIKDGYAGRDLANSAYMASIDEELSDKENQSMVDLNGDNVLGFDDLWTYNDC